MRISALLAILAAGLLLVACAKPMPPPYPQPEDLWADAENYVRQDAGIRDKVGPIEVLRRSRIEIQPSGRQRDYHFLLKAVKGSGAIMVTYRYKDDIWQAQRWRYDMGFPPADS